MSISDVASSCAKAIEARKERISLVVVRTHPPTGENVRLVRQDRKSPLGVVLNWVPQAKTVLASFDATDVLAYLAANGLVKIKATDDGRNE